VTDRGSALLEVLVVGFAVVALVGHALIAIGRVESAGNAVAETAQEAALHAARHGDAAAAHEVAAALLPAASITVDESTTTISVEVTLVISLLGPEGFPIQRTVRGRAEAVRSPYRSG
jgi:hypothetical protein